MKLKALCIYDSLYKETGGLCGRCKTQDWLDESGILCGSRISMKLNDKFYRNSVRPIMLYGSEC